jgi:hypothetical protein
MRRMTAWAGACGWVIALLAPAAGASQLSWDGPPQCAERDSLLFQVERALGAPLERSGQLDFYVRVSQSASSASAQLRVTRQPPRGEPSERVLVAAHCSKLVEMLAVAISLAIGEADSGSDVSAGSGVDVDPAPADREPVGPVVPAAGGAPAGLEPPQPVPAVDEGQGGPEPAAVALMVADVGSLPSPALGAALGVQLGWSRLQLLALATFYVDQRAQIETSGGSPVGGDLSLALGSLLACSALLSTAGSGVVPLLCGGLDVGRFAGVGRGVLEVHQGALLWVGPRLDAGVFWRVPQTPLRLEALLGAALPLNREPFVLDDIGTVHRPSRVVGRASLGLNLIF